MINSVMTAFFIHLHSSHHMEGKEEQTVKTLSIRHVHDFSASFRNGLNRSSGIGKAIVELFSAAIWFKVWR